MWRWGCCYCLNLCSMKSCDSVSLSETRSPIRRSEMISARFSGRLCALRGARARSASPHLSALIRLHCRIETLHYGDHCEATLQALIRLRNLDSLLQEGGFNERFALHWLFSKAHPFNTALKSQSAVGSFRSFYPFQNFLLWYYLRRFFLLSNQQSSFFYTSRQCGYSF